MCFSAHSSFAAAATVSLLGIASLKRSSPHTRMIAATPLLFGLQQASEGFTWLALTGKISTDILSYSVILFLTCAFILWPLWVPYAMLQAENNLRARKGLAICLGAGVLIAIILGYILFVLGVSATNISHHIEYTLKLPCEISYASAVSYTIPTILPFFISSHTIMRVLGSLLLLSYIAAAYMWFAAFTSVWCFFAAVISSAIYFIIPKL